jgi:hypothetical protein
MRLAQLLLAQMMPIDAQWVRIMSVTMTAHAGGVQGCTLIATKKGTVSAS